MVFGVLSFRYLSKFFPVGPSLIILLDPPISSPHCSRDFFKMNRLSDNLPLPLIPNNSVLLVSLLNGYRSHPNEPLAMSHSHLVPSLLALLTILFLPLHSFSFSNTLCSLLPQAFNTSALDWQTSPLYCDCALLLVPQVSLQTSLLCCRASWLLQLSQISMSIGSYLPILTQLVNIYILCGC